MEQWAKAKHLLRTGYIGFLGPIYQYVISTFNTCSGVPTTARSLIDTDGATTSESRLATALSPPFPADDLLFHLIALSGLQLTNFIIIIIQRAIVVEILYSRVGLTTRLLPWSYT